MYEHSNILFTLRANKCNYLNELQFNVGAIIFLTHSLINAFIVFFIHEKNDFAERFKILTG